MLTFSVDTVGGDSVVGYRYQTSHYSSRRRDNRGDSARRGSRHEEINHYSLLNVGQSVDGVERIGYRSQTIPSTSHHSDDNGRSSGFIVVAITSLVKGITPATFLHITMLD